MLDAHPTCTACDLHEGARSVGIPMRKLHSAPKQCAPAIVLVGEKPSAEEDRTGSVFRGPIGKLYGGAYGGFLHAACAKAGHPAHIYGTNIVRCAPPGGTSPTASHWKHCLLHLQADVACLRQLHGGPIILLACGGPASKALVGSSLRGAFRRQGAYWGPDPDVRVFATFSPGVLARNKDPSLRDAVQDHLDLVKDFIVHGKIPTLLDVPRLWGCWDKFPEDVTDRRVSLDLETYGAVAGLPKQTVFHPERSIHVDKCPREQLIQTIGATVRVNGKDQHSVWVYPDDLDKFMLFAHGAPDGTIWFGQNFVFDVLYCRAGSSRLRRLFSRPLFLKRKWLLGELMVSNYLDSDVRWERSQKALAPLLRVFEYDEASDLSTGFRYDSKWDDELHAYNTTDTSVALACDDKLRERIAKRYGTNSAKLSGYSRQWYSDRVWDCVEMSENGVAMDLKRLLALDRKTAGRMRHMWGFAWRRWQRKIAGPGSVEDQTAMVTDAVKVAGLVGSRLIRKTKGSAKEPPRYCCDKANRNILIGKLRRNSPEYLQMKVMNLYAKWGKLHSSYTQPLLHDRKKGCLVKLPGLNRAMAYPQWYPIPANVDPQDEKVAGTKQSRFSCRKPSLPTFPRLIKGAIVGRYPGGQITKGDSSQLELRVMALLSGDSVMLADFRRGADPHTEMGILILQALYDIMQTANAPHVFGVPRVWLGDLLADPSAITKKTPGFNKWRQIGKVVNFAIGFRGTAETVQQSIRRDTGVELSRGVCQGIVARTDEKCHGLRSWQDDLIEQAIDQRYLEIPLTGGGRLFIGARSDIIEAYSQTICNILVQAVAAQIVQSAQREIGDIVAGSDMLIFDNDYDAIGIDHRARDTAQVTSLLRAHMTNPQYFQDLCSVLGRTVPLEVEIN